jgi:hypothetical protein
LLEPSLGQPCGERGDPALSLAALLAIGRRIRLLQVLAIRRE